MFKNIFFVASLALICRLTNGDWDNIQTSDAPSVNANSSAQEIAEEHANFMKSVDQSSNLLVQKMGLREDIVVAAYGVEDYTPANDKSGFWKNTITPMIMRSLTEDIKGRDFLVKAVSAITSLGITIREGVDILVKSKGSQAAVKIVKNRIPEALKLVKTVRDQVEHIESGAMNDFANQTGTIFEIIGTNQANFAKSRAEQEGIIASAWDTRQKYINNLAQQQGDITRLNALVVATMAVQADMKVEKEQDKEEAKKIADQMNQLNSKITDQMAHIPSVLEESGQDHYGWWWWRGCSSYHKQVSNPDYAQDIGALKNVIDTNNAQIIAAQGVVKAKETIIENLGVSLSNYKGQLTTAMENFASYAKNISTLISSPEKTIKTALAAIDQINSDQQKTEDKIGSKGSVLIDCIKSTRVYAEKMHSAPAFEPMAAILNSTISTVQSAVDLLVTGTSTDIITAATMLNEKVKYISSFAVNSGKSLLTISDDYRKIINNQTIQRYLALEGITFVA